MAQTGFTPIVTYNTATATTVPSAANLAQGELAVNVTDKKLYTKDSGGNVVLLASNGGDVTGPASSTNLAIPTFSGTGGKTLLNNSGATITAGVITATGFAGPLNGSLGATTPSTASVTSINKMAITAPATSSTLAIADGKTFTASNTLTLTGTDSTTMTFPTTSATIARTDAAQTFTGTQTFDAIIINQLQAQSTKSNYNLGGSAAVTFNVTVASNANWTTGVIKIEATGSDRTSGGLAGAWWQYANVVLNANAPINVLADSGGTTGSFVVAISGNSGTGTQVLTITVTATNLDGITASLSISNLLGVTSIS